MDPDTPLHLLAPGGTAGNEVAKYGHRQGHKAGTRLGFTGAMVPLIVPIERLMAHYYCRDGGAGGSQRLKGLPRGHRKMLDNAPPPPPEMIFDGHPVQVTAFPNPEKGECLPGARPARYLSINYPDFSPRFTLSWRSPPSRPYCTAHLPYKARCIIKQYL